MEKKSGKNPEKTSGRLFRKKIPEKNFRPELIFFKNFTEKKKIRKKIRKKIPEKIPAGINFIKRTNQRRV